MKAKPVVVEQGGYLPEHTAAMAANYHLGRSWSGHRVEDTCPCPSQPCGLVVPSSGCEEHDPRMLKTIRQLHKATECPGADERLSAP